MRKYIFFILFVMLCLPVMAQKKKAVKKVAKVTETIAPDIMIDSLLRCYRFDQTIEYINSQNNKSKNKKAKQNEISTYDKELDLARIGANMIRATEKIVFIDSIVISKDIFLKALNISNDCGSIINDNPSNDSLLNSTSYINDFEDKKIYTNKNNKLEISYLINGKWCDAEALQGLDENGDAIQGFPFLLADGSTLYYSSIQEGGMGGYDIYVTRYNADTKRYLKPENIGMPFNSPANDYLYVIDETSNIGWFVTDRNQPKDKVCVYSFIPTDSRETYEFDEDNDDANNNTRKAAMIHDIASTQVGRTTEVKQALERIKNINSSNVISDKQDFVFAIGPKKTYHSLSDFKNEKAKKLATDWRINILQRKKLQQELQDNRHTYAKGNHSVANEIIKAESQLETLNQQIKELEKEIRRIEQ